MARSCSPAPGSKPDARNCELGQFNFRYYVGSMRIRTVPTDIAISLSLIAVFLLSFIPGVFNLLWIGPDLFLAARKLTRKRLKNDRPINNRTRRPDDTEAICH